MGHFVTGWEEARLGVYLPPDEQLQDPCSYSLYKLRYIWVPNFLKQKFKKQPTKQIPLIKISDITLFSDLGSLGGRLTEKLWACSSPH